MKKTSKVLSIIAAAVLAFSSISCSTGKNDEGSGGNSNETVNKQTSSLFEGGVHVYNYTPTDKMLVQNGLSDYSIVIPDQDVGDKYEIASRDLNYYFEQATGVSLPIVKESSVTYSQSAHFISLGNNAVFQAAGLSVDDLSLGYNGLIIKTVGESIFIAGESQMGALYGVYVFLELEFNFDVFGKSTYSLDTNRRDVALRAYDVKDIPDIEIRKSSAYWVTEENIYRMRYDLTAGHNDYDMGVQGAHSWDKVLPLELHYEAHPYWFANNKKHLCYTAHGDEAELALMVEAIAANVKERLKTYPNAFIFKLGHGDELTWCDCAACKASMEKYNGSRAAAGIKLLNAVEKNIDAWFLTEEGKSYQRDYRLLLLSYGMTLIPPTKYDSVAKKWVPIDDSVVCGDKVMPWYAPLETDYQVSLYDEKNKQFLDQYNGWKALSKEMSFYTYSGNYKHMTVPVDMFVSLQETYQMMASCNALLVNEDTLSNPGGMTAWMNLRNYLVSKLGWNVNIDMEKTVNTFFDNFYGEAADTMLSLFKNMRAHMAYQEKYLFTTHGIYSNPEVKDYWPKNLLDEWLAQINKAVEEIEFWKQIDIYEYQKLYDNITSERISIEYMMVQFYEDKYSDEYIHSIKLQCKEDATRIGIDVNDMDNRTLSEVFASWGI